MIRQLSKEELPLCFEGGRLFFEEADLPGGFKPEVFLERVGALVEAGTGVVLGAFGDDGAIHGALAAVIYDDIYTGQKTATELFWFMLPNYRGGMEAMRLLRSFERWARDSGCARCAMIHLLKLQPKELSSLYTRCGYTPIETSYIKGLLSPDCCPKTGASR